MSIVGFDGPQSWSLEYSTLLTPPPVPTGILYSPIDIFDLTEKKNRGGGGGVLSEKAYNQPSTILLLKFFF